MGVTSFGWRQQCRKSLSRVRGIENQINFMNSNADFLERCATLRCIIICETSSGCNIRVGARLCIEIVRHALSHTATDRSNCTVCEMLLTCQHIHRITRVVEPSLAPPRNTRENTSQPHLLIAANNSCGKYIGNLMLSVSNFNLQHELTGPSDE